MKNSEITPYEVQKIKTYLSYLCTWSCFVKVSRSIIKKCKLGSKNFNDVFGDRLVIALPIDLQLLDPNDLICLLITVIEFRDVTVLKIYFISKIHIILLIRKLSQLLRNLFHLKVLNNKKRMSIVKQLYERARDKGFQGPAMMISLYNLQIVQLS